MVGVATSLPSIAVVGPGGIADLTGGDWFWECGGSAGDGLLWGAGVIGFLFPS